MIAAIAVALFVVLGAIAALHAYWAAGGLWPGRDKADLLTRVIGQAGRRRMPPAWMTGAVAAAIAVTALVPLFAARLVPAPAPGAAITAIAVLIGLVFLARGIAGYLPAWRRVYSVEPFATRDRNLFSPLCILIAAGYGAILLNGGGA